MKDKKTNVEYNAAPGMSVVVSVELWEKKPKAKDEWTLKMKEAHDVTVESTLYSKFDRPKVKRK